RNHSTRDGNATRRCRRRRRSSLHRCVISRCGNEPKERGAVKNNILVAIALIAFGLHETVEAAERPLVFPSASPGEGKRAAVKAAVPPTRFDWTGPYVGFHSGYGGGSFGPGTNGQPTHGVFFPATITGLIGGYQAGYNFQAANGVVLGAEADVTFI